LGNTPLECSTPQTGAPSASTEVAPSRTRDWDAYAKSPVITSSGAVGSITAALPSGSSTLEIEIQLPSEAQLTLELPDTGSALAVADLDGDGNIEVVTSRASEEGAPDQLRIHSLQKGTLKQLTQLDMDPIGALAVCPFDGKNPLTLLVATEKELWILR